MAAVPKHSSKCQFRRVTLRGSNVGAAMITRGASPGEPPQDDRHCSINIYVNNNIQGVNGSVLVGSTVELADPGVYLCVGDVEGAAGHARRSRRTRSAGETTGLGFLGMLLLLLLLVFSSLMMSIL
uniref:Uncharacterized protein n=1 Tax=Kalanchoe fedtschenkoi TaxID=63787 RepID=A0A7N0T7Q7_KALFE